MNLASLVPLCHLVFEGILWVQNFFSWVLRGSQIFSRGFFVGPRFLLVGVSWVQNFSGRVFREPKNFLVGIL